MTAAMYLICAATSLLCTVVLLRNYWNGGARLLLWSGLCFAGLTLDNITLLLDIVVFPDVDLSLYRKVGTLVGLMLLIYGLVWDAT
jgi:hypothetical protein